MNCHRISELVAPPRHSGQGQREKVTSSGTHLTLPRLLGTFTDPQVLAQLSFFTPYSPAQIPNPHTHYTGLCPTRWSSLKFIIEYTCMTGLGKTHVPLPRSAWKGTYSTAAAACAQPLTPLTHTISPTEAGFQDTHHCHPQTLGAETPSPGNGCH